jgi:putative ATP-dependent endonuclease of OLD family
MYVSRLVVRNFRNFETLDVCLSDGPNCVVGENNSGKSNLLHAIRLVLDQTLPSYSRVLSEDDIHSSVDLSQPSQVVVAIEFSDWADSDKASALVGEWEVEENLARLTYRFRPRKAVRDDLDAGERAPGSLAIGDYGWELRGGGAIGPTDITWDQDTGIGPRLGHLQAFQVTFLHPLRDVARDLRATRVSPLNRLIEVVGIPDDEKANLIEVLRTANKEIAESPTITTLGDEMSGAFAATTGAASALELKLGVADPSFSTITRSLRLLLSDSSLSDFDPSRNGLGLNNVLYISMLLQYFEARAETEGVAGQLLLIEEPEAHLHPQLQRSLYGVLAEKAFQSILTTHSTHVTSKASLESIVTLTRTVGPAVSVAEPGRSSGLDGRQIADLERYLDATRSTLLYARSVMLVEGPAELFLIPPLAKAVMAVDFDQEGISVVPIYGTHFSAYARLFGEGALQKRCAVVGDKDLKPSDADQAPDPKRIQDLMDMENEFVRVFLCETTFERELATPGMVKPLRKVAEEVGAKALAKELGLVSEDEVTDALGDKVLAAAKRIGKARFAQSVSCHCDVATEMPEYIASAVDFLTTTE